MIDPWSSFTRLADAAGLIALDVGARNGISRDLARIGSSVDFYCFEPDRLECERLSAADPPRHCRSVNYIPWALGSEESVIDLNLYRQRGCSSKFEAMANVGARFARGDYYVLEGTVSVRTRALDDVLRELGVQQPAFMKIDVQGMEVEVFAGAAEALSKGLVSVRTEVSFLPIYRDQPLFADVDAALRPYGFVPMRWLELHEWRRTTRIKPPRMAGGSMPYSRGQMIHGDVLYLQQPEGLPTQTDDEVRRLVRLGLVSACYDHFDHARAAFEMPRVREYCRSEADSDPVAILEGLSRDGAGVGRRLRVLFRNAVGRTS